MSFDMFVQRFRDGDAAELDATVFQQIFGVFIDGTKPETSVFHLRLSDGGEADAYVQPTGATFTHFGGEQFLDLVVKFAQLADAVLVPVGCPVCIVDERQKTHLPEELRANVRLIANGADLEAVFDDA